MTTYKFHKKRHDNYLQYYVDIFKAVPIDENFLKIDNENLKGHAFIYEIDDMRIVMLDYHASNDFSIYIEHDESHDYSIHCFPYTYLYTNEKSETTELTIPLGVLHLQQNEIIHAEIKAGYHVQTVSLYFSKKNISEHINGIFNHIKKFKVEVGDSNYIQWRDNFFNNSKEDFHEELYNEWTKLKLLELFTILKNMIIDNDLKKDLETNFHDYEIDIAASIKKMIDSDTNFKPNVKELAAAYNIKQPKLNEVFKVTYGLSIFQYYKKNRMIKAKGMVRNTNKTFGEIAKELNFTDINHFSKSFIEMYDMTPTDYRNSLKK